MPTLFVIASQCEFGQRLFGKQHAIGMGQCHTRNDRWTILDGCPACWTLVLLNRNVANVFGGRHASARLSPADCFLLRPFMDDGSGRLVFAQALKCRLP